MDVTLDQSPTKRPLSLPSLTNSDPTSPVATCCSCYLSKSTGDIFRQKSERNSLLGKRKLSAGPKLLLSVFKKKDSLKSDIIEEKQSKLIAPDAARDKNHYLKATTWTYVSNPLDSQRPNLRKMSKDSMPVPSEKEENFVITPTYQSFTVFKYKKQQLKPPKTEKPKKEASNIATTSTIRKSQYADELRISLLKKNVAPNQDGQKSLLVADVPRSPGPLDGSPYAQVRKKKSLKSTRNHHFPSNREFHSAEELSSSFPEPKAKQVLAAQGEASLKSQLPLINVIVEKEGSLLPSMSDSHENLVEKSINELDNLSENGYREIDLLDTGQKVENKENTSKDVDLCQNEASPSEVIQSGGSLVKEHGPQNDIALSETIKNAVHTETAESIVIESISIMTSSLHYEHEDQASVVSKEEEEIFKENETPLLSSEDTEDDAETLSTGSSNDEDDAMSELSSRSSSSSNNEMRPQVKKQLTKEEVRDAVALINECLSDQEMRSGSMTPVDTPKGVHGIAKLSESSFAAALADAPQAQLDAGEPDLPPALPDYHSTELELLYANKSPEYALPEKDVIHRSIATRTAELRVQETAVQNLNSPNDVVPPQHPALEITRQMGSHMVISTHNNSSDSGRGSTQDQLENLRKTTSSSDVDSGIDGSALSFTKTEVKTKSVTAGSKQSNPTSTVTVSQRVESSGTTQDSTKTDKMLSPDHVSSEHPEEDVEDEEEKRVREEIENTQKRLAWLHEHQTKLKKEKEEKIKRYSFGYNAATNTETVVKHSEISATLPRPPGHHKPVATFYDGVKNRKPSPQEQKDIDELLRSVQELNFSKPAADKPNKVFPDVSMSTATATISSSNPQPHLHQNFSYHTTGRREMKRSNQFTPAYAHPMHQPDHMDLHHYQRQNQEETRKKQGEEKRNLLQQERFEREKKKKEVDVQEKRREEEREMQQKFEMQFEQRQMQLQKAKPVQKQISAPVPVLPVKHSSSRMPAKQTKPSFTTLQSPSFNTPGSSMTLPSPRKHDHQSPPSVPLKSDELQMQLDELDKYISQLTQNLEDVGTNNPSLPQQPTNTGKAEVIRRRRSFSIENERKMDPNIPLSTDEKENQSGTPPKPPSRTRSSYDSVSKRLSHGFELAQYMRQNSTDNDVTAKEDEVFTATATPQPSYPPQTRHTRPIQQQIAANAPQVSRTPPQKIQNLEENLSPQLFLAMSVNPGARPVEEVHSYKEDLDPLASSEDVVDGAPQTTPHFPVSPNTPHGSNTAASPTHKPAGLAQTPLSALGLKPVQHKTEDEEPSVEPDHSAINVNKQPMVHVSGPTTSSNLTKANTSGSNAFVRNRLKDNSSQDQQLSNGGIAERLPSNGINDMKSTLLSNHSHDSGYADTHQALQGPNGWIQNSQAPDASRIQSANTPKDELKSPWVYSGSSSPQSSTPGGKSPGPSFAYSSTSGELSPNASRSLTGSSDSLLSNGSSSSQPHYAYQQEHLNGSHPSLPNKDSSLRNSGSSIRSTSTGSGYLGGTSRTSPHSAGSPASSGPGPYPLSHPPNKRESQLSTYDRQGVPHGHQMGYQDGLHTPVSLTTSSSSTSDAERLSQDLSNSSITGPAPKFIKDTTAYWYKPDITREQALSMLRDRSPGSFVVRDSRCYPGAFGLALKVHKVPAAVLATAKPGTDMNNELVRHFLIEPSSRGVKLKGCVNEPVFGSLSALIYQHSITSLALPCMLVIPTENQEIPQFVGTGPNVAEVSNTASELLRQGAACNVVYISSVDTESLTGPEAVDRAMRDVLIRRPEELKTSIVHFKVSPQGITLTDNARKVFFRRHYPTSSLTYCGIDPRARDPHNRSWDASKYRGPTSARVFGFVAKKPGSTVDNVCHLFAELDLDQPAPAIVNFVTKVLIGST